MDLKHIEELLEKYNDGVTTLQEEQKLKAYFSNEPIAKHLKVYQPLFTYYKKQNTVKYVQPITVKTKSRRPIYTLSIAALLLLMFGVYLNRPTPQEQLGTFNEDEVELAYKTFKETMTLVSVNINKGTSNIKYIASLNRGVDQLQHLNKFNTATQIIFKPKH